MKNAWHITDGRWGSGVLVWVLSLLARVRNSVAIGPGAMPDTGGSARAQWRTKRVRAARNEVDADGDAGHRLRPRLRHRPRPGPVLLTRTKRLRAPALFFYMPARRQVARRGGLGRGRVSHSRIAMNVDRGEYDTSGRESIYLGR